MSALTAAHCLDGCERTGACACAIARISAATRGGKRVEGFSPPLHLPPVSGLRKLREFEAGLRPLSSAGTRA